jgi:hypothetical protein
LYWSEHWPIRKIERHLNMGWQTIKKYLDAPAQGPAKRERRSKLNPFRATIAEWLRADVKTGTLPDYKNGQTAVILRFSRDPKRLSHQFPGVGYSPIPVYLCGKI